MTVSGRSDIIDISGTIKNQTEKAVLLDDGTREVWLPKSQVEIDYNPKGLSTVAMPEWLAKEKGLI